MSFLPDPVHLGFPEKFDGWRPNQDAAILAALDSPKRFVVLNAPTGFGKTGVYFGAALLSGSRTAFLTSSKGLQSQLLVDFAPCGLVDIRGQNNYLCRALQPDGIYYGQGIQAGDRCDAGPCHVGAYCSARQSGCYYFDALRIAQKEKLVTTNYSYWIAQHRYSDGLSKFDMLVLDEADLAPSELAASLEVEISDYDAQTIASRNLPVGDESEVWKHWAILCQDNLQAQFDRLDAEIKQLRAEEEDVPYTMLREIHAVRGLLAKITVIATMEGEWIVDRRSKSARLAPVWPGPYADRLLFLNIPKILLVSATVTEKTLELLGVQRDDFDFFQYPSTFPIERRPVTYIPSVRLQHKWTEIEQKTWVRRIDRIIDDRLDRKGIIHTTSYERRNLILTYSEHRAILLYNDGSNTRTIVEKFRKASPPCILVSPSLTFGWDLPFEECEYAIVGKVPFPDTSSPIVKARTHQDKEYGPYCAMQIIVQSCGRGMRDAQDQCEMFILDDQWVWFWRKFRKFAPRWFQDAVRRSIAIPNPLPKLQTFKGEKYA